MQDEATRIRLDKWLWAARFFRTRGLAQEAVGGGRVHVNGERAKRSRIVETGDRLSISRGEERFEVIVRSVTGTRGPASAAQALYEETEASRTQREERAATRKLQRQSAPRPDTKPDKKQRRHIIRFKERG